MLRNGEYCRADNLCVGMSLMPLHIQKQEGYIWFKDNVDNVKKAKIKSIEIIRVNNEPVYDIEVDETSNFLLEAGVFVHNSKDIADSVCGAINNALEYPTIEEIQRINDLNYFIEETSDNTIDYNRYSNYNMFNGEDKWNL